MMKKIFNCYLFIIFVSTLLFSSIPPLEISAALRDETRTITTTNWTDTQVHQYYDDFVTEAMTGNTLKTALNNRIKNHTTISPYAETKYAMAIVDRKYKKFFNKQNKLSPMSKNSL